MVPELVHTNENKLYSHKHGYETMTELTKDFMAGRFPPITEDPPHTSWP